MNKENKEKVLPATAAAKEEKFHASGDLFVAICSYR